VLDGVPFGTNLVGSDNGSDVVELAPASRDVRTETKPDSLAMSDYYEHGGIHSLAWMVPVLVAPVGLSTTTNKSALVEPMSLKTYLAHQAFLPWLHAEPAWST
jgi:hypothetical protein